MPFHKAKGGGYKSSSGKKYTSAQVRMYHATGGFKKAAKKAKSYHNSSH